MLIGGIMTAGIAMAWNMDEWQPGRKKMVKMGKQFARKMGIM